MLRIIPRGCFDSLKALRNERRGVSVPLQLEVF